MISRDLTQKEKDYLESQKKHPRSNMIAVDAIALIVNNDNPIEILSISEIATSLTGKITKWSDIRPTKLGDIQVVFDDEGSSTVKYMLKCSKNVRPTSGSMFSHGASDTVYRRNTQVQQVAAGQPARCSRERLTARFIGATYGESVV